MKNDDRLQNLEIKIAFLEKTIEDLSEAMVEQDRVLDDIRKEIADMRKSLDKDEIELEPYEPTRE